MIIQTEIAPVIIACGSLTHEFESLIRPDHPVRITYLDTDLHRTPVRIPEILQKEIDQIDGKISNDADDLNGNKPPIIIGYGLCSNAVVGITALKRPLVIPRVHDCLDLFLGFMGKGRRRSDSNTRHYYLTPGTLLNRKDPYSIMTHEYTPKMGEKTAQWGMKEELKHYTHFDLITTVRDDMEEIRKAAQINADFFDMELNEIASDLSCLEKILYGPHDDHRFIRVEPGKTVEQGLFI